MCPKWSQWEEWNSCSASCGEGTTQRRRVCQYGDNCEGDATETVSCTATECAAPLEWSNWSSCSESCGSGTFQGTQLLIRF